MQRHFTAKRAESFAQFSHTGNARQGPRHHAHGKRLPPYAVSVGWKLCAGRKTPIEYVPIYTGSLALAEAKEQVDCEKRLTGRCRFEPIPLAALPFGADPGLFDWGFVAGLRVGIVQCGRPETDANLLALVRLLVEAAAVLVTAVLSGGRLGFFTPDGEV